MGARAEIESLLRARKLDVTLTSETPWSTTRPREDREIAPTGMPALDEALGGGMPRGHISEVVGPRSSGRTTVLCRMLAAAALRGEAVALIDTCDRFDPVSADAAGVDLSKLLWIRDTGDATRALKGLNLVLQAGGFGLVAFDLVDVPLPRVRQFPQTTWMRIGRVIEGSRTAAVLLGADRIARTPGGVTITLDRSPAQWSGTADRARLLRTLPVRPRVTGGKILTR